MRVSFNSYERSITDGVILSFNTRNAGIYQIKYKHGKQKLKEIKTEPPLHMFTSNEATYMLTVGAIVYRMIYDAPACTERFES